MSTQIDIHLLESTDINSKLNYACRYTRKAVSNGLRVLIHAENEAQAEYMDSLLWSFDPQSFVPHERYDTQAVGNDGSLPDITSCPVWIHTGASIPGDIDMLINIATGWHGTGLPVARITDIIENDESAKSAGRVRYQVYNKLKMTINVHRITQKHAH